MLTNAYDSGLQARWQRAAGELAAGCGHADGG